MRHVLILLALAGTLPATAADRLEDWQGGEAGIFTHAQEGPVRVGTVSADGTLSFDWPVVDASGQSLDATFPSCREDGEPIASPGSAGFWPTSLFLARGTGRDAELGALHLATSKDIVTWRGSYGQGDAARGAWFQHVFVSVAAKVEADCVMPTYTGEGDAANEDKYDQATVYRASFQPGWNLMRNDITALHDAPSGKHHASRIEIGVVPARPEDARWYFEAY
jgi:hypothetical protein